MHCDRLIPFFAVGQYVTLGQVSPGGVRGKQFSSSRILGLRFRIASLALQCLSQLEMGLRPIWRNANG